MKIDVLTLFPDMINDGLSHSILGRAQENNIIEINAINFRDYANNKHKSVDDSPYGGGAGMVITPQPVIDAIKAVNGDKKARVIYMTPKGTVLNQSLSNELSKEEHLVFLCGHYEGIDQRVIDKYVTDEISIGDYVLTGGELPALVVIDSVARLIDGVIGKNESFEDESFYNGLLEYPHYTRPSEYEGMKVPDILLSGNHKKIDEWREEKSIEITFDRRPELINAILKDRTLDKEQRQKIINIINKK